jgi:hypothetical protein
MPQNKLKRDAYLDGDNQFPGLPGYRTRRGRSGYDPLDTNREAAFMEGMFYRKLLTLKVRRHNAFYLALMLIFGIAVSGFMSFAWYAILSTPTFGEKDLVYYLVFGSLYLMFGLVLAIGLALLVNFAINIGVILRTRKGKQKQSNDAKS